jgi:hypothetical protein
LNGTNPTAGFNTTHIGFQNLLNIKTLKKIWWNENIVSPLQCISDVVHSKSKNNNDKN